MSRVSIQLHSAVKRSLHEVRHTRKLRGVAVSICPRVSFQKPFKGFLWHFVLKIFTKSCEGNLILVRIGPSRAVTRNVRGPGQSILYGPLFKILTSKEGGKKEDKIICRFNTADSKLYVYQKVILTLFWHYNEINIL
jgi:hypothetical protein